jgi:hypothetical protein
MDSQKFALIEKENPGLAKPEPVLLKILARIETKHIGSANISKKTLVKPNRLQYLYISIYMEYATKSVAVPCRARGILRTNHGLNFFYNLIITSTL